MGFRGVAGVTQTPWSVDELIFMRQLCGQNHAACNETMLDRSVEQLRQFPATGSLMIRKLPLPVK